MLVLFFQWEVEDSTCTKNVHFGSNQPGNKPYVVCYNLLTLRLLRKMNFLFLLNLKAIKSQECADYEFAIKCMDHCYLDQKICMTDCGEKETCRFECYNLMSDCLNQCPCQKECPRGCEACSHSICDLKGIKNFKWTCG